MICYSIWIMLTCNIMHCLLNQSVCLFTTKPYSTHTKYDWLVYWLAFCLICKVHWFWRPNQYLFRNRRVKVLAWPRGNKIFFVLVLRPILRTRSLCSTEYDTKNRGFKSFGLRFPLSWIWNTYSNIIIYGVSRDCFKKCRNLDNYRVKQT